MILHGMLCARGGGGGEKDESVLLIIKVKRAAWLLCSDTMIGFRWQQIGENRI